VLVNVLLRGVILVFGKTGQVAKELQCLGGVVALGREHANFV
jgi:hypothetical protein